MTILGKKCLLICFVAPVLMYAGSAYAQVKTFETTFGGSANDLGNFVQQTSDGGYILCGAKGNPGTVGYYDYSLIKINPYGTVQWNRTIGDSLYDEQAQCVRQMNDGSYIVYGSRSGPSISTAWLVKTDGNGNKNWAVEQQGSDSGRFGYSVVAAPDGGYQTASFDNAAGGANYFQLQKTNEAGTLQWGPKTVVQGIGLNSSLALTQDGNYISVGTTDVKLDGPTQNYYSMITLLKMTPSGSSVWSKTYKAIVGTKAFNYLQGFGVQATNDGGYIICGATSINTRGGTDIFLLKTDSNGDSLWSKNYGGSANDVALSVKETPDGGYAVAGNTKSFGSGSTDVFILKTNAVGDSLWMRMFGGSGTETAGNIEVTSDSGFIVIGTTNSYGSGQSDILLLRTNSEGRIPNADVLVPNGICGSGSVTLTATSGYTYLWNNGSTTQSITVTQAGNYSVTVKDSYNNINVSKNVVITIDHPLTSSAFTVGGPSTFCAGTSVMLTADSAAGDHYQWQVNGADISNANTRRYAATEDGNYNIVISNACNAIASSSTTLHVLPAPAIPTITIAGKSLVSSSSTYNQWYRNGVPIQGAVANTYTPTQNGTYTLVVSNESGCTSVSQPVTLNTVGIEEIDSYASYIVFPNPATDVVYVDYTVKSSQGNYFVIYSAEGKEVFREKLENEKGLININSGNLAGGLYFSGIETQGAFAGRKTLAIIHH